MLTGVAGAGELPGAEAAGPPDGAPVAAGWPGTLPAGAGFADGAGPTVPEPVLVVLAGALGVAEGAGVTVELAVEVTGAATELTVEVTGDTTELTALASGDAAELTAEVAAETGEAVDACVDARGASAAVVA